MYIASDTPPEVCQFLSQLKQRGDFSYEILQIIAKHVRAAEKPSETTAVDAQAQASSVSPTPERVKQPVSETVHMNERNLSQDEPEESGPEPDVAVTAPVPKMDPIQMLRQQRKALVAGGGNT